MTATTYHIPGRGEYCDQHHYLLDAFGVCGLCKLVERRERRMADAATILDRNSGAVADSTRTSDPRHDHIAHEAWRQGRQSR